MYVIFRIVLLILGLYPLQEKTIISGDKKSPQRVCLVTDKSNNGDKSLLLSVVFVIDQNVAAKAYCRQ